MYNIMIGWCYGMTFIEDLKDNDAVQWAIDKFIKVGLVGFLIIAILLVMKIVFGLHFTFEAGFNL